jgi:hypothetical protein
VKEVEFHVDRNTGLVFTGPTESKEAALIDLLECVICIDLRFVLQEVVIHWDLLYLAVNYLRLINIWPMIVNFLGLSDSTLFGWNRIIEGIFMRSNLVQMFYLISMSIRDKEVSISDTIIALKIIVFWEVHPINIGAHLSRIRSDRFSKGISMRLSTVRLSKGVIGDNCTTVSEPNSFFEHIEKAILLSRLSS